MLLDWQWNLEQFVEWCLENQAAILHDVQSVAGKQLEAGECLAHAHRRLLDREFPDEAEEEMFRYDDALYEFYSTHCLHFGLTGAAIPDPNIIIGCKDGMGEISLCEEAQQWCYRFEMRTFWRELLIESRHFILAWMTTNQNDIVKNHASALLQGLEHASEYS